MDGSGVDPSSSNEQFVELENLAFTIRELSSEMMGGGGGDEDNQVGDTDSVIVDSTASSHMQGSIAAREVSNRSANLKLSVDCVYVDHDHYFDSDRPVNKADTSSWKVVLKTMKAITQKGEQFVSGLANPSSTGETLPVFAVADISFWALRDFGTSLMKRATHEQSAVGACRQITEEYPKFKRILKTLSSAIDSYMRRNGYWSTSHNSNNNNQSSNGHLHHHSRKLQLISLLLYSRPDDRFDLVSLDTDKPPDESSRLSRRK